MSVSRASCGLLVPAAPDLPSSVHTVNTAGYDFLVSALVHPRYVQHEHVADVATLDGAVPAPKEAAASKARQWPFTRSDLLLGSGDWSSLFVAVVTPPWGMEAKEPPIRRRAEERLKRELNFAGHLGLSAMLVSLKGPRNVNMSRHFHSFLSKSNATPQVWLRVPINKPKSLSSGPDDDDSDPWQWWSDFRANADYDKKLNLALDLGNGDEVTPERMERWLGEPIKAIVLNTRLYLTNKKGYPVLPRTVQTTIRRFIQLNVQIIIEGHCQDGLDGVIGTPKGGHLQHSHDMKRYQTYLDHLWQTHESADPVKQFAKGYEDFLQTPLQPLSDNLDSGTYEVFEKDPIKYAQYQQAIYKAILAKRPAEEMGEKAPSKLPPPLTVMVLGAGRGPLVRASLMAADMCRRRIRVYAVEKNPNAIVTLLTQKNEDWGDQVTVISSDMRDWHPSEADKADIIVSELLGSFGDNELSPECLYSAQHLFKSDAISIPTSYTSWIGPLQSSKIYNEVRGSHEIGKHPLAHFETPYVVHFQNRTDLAPPQPLFTFEHPLRGPIDHNRYSSLTFHVPTDCELHGFGGYFECELYDGVMISINPATHSKGMFSWFPIFFPLREPLSLRNGQEVELNFWRVNNGVQVWYEWCLSKPVATPIHNPNGRSYTIGLQ